MTLLGSTTPRIWTPTLIDGKAGPCGCGCALTDETSLGFAVAEFADLVGFPLLPWQRWLAIHGLELLADGRPRFRTVLVLVARQSGKTSFLKVLALFWLLVQQIPLVLGTSTKLDYARESWAGAVDIAYSSDVLTGDLLPRRQGVREANGEQTLTTPGGCRYKIAAANADAGRSLTVHRLILDELRQHKSWAAWGAATKAMMAVADAQGWAITNAGDEGSIVLSTLRSKALGQLREDAGPGDAEGVIGLFEWSAPPGCAIDDRDAWAQANPALGYGAVTESAIAEAMMTDPEPVFRTEVLCQSVDSLTPRVIPIEAWAACLDLDSAPADAMTFGVEISLDRSTGTIGAAGVRQDGLRHVEIVERRPGTEWLLSRVVELYSRHGYPVVIDAAGPAGSLIAPLQDRGVTVTTPTAAQVAAECARLRDEAVDGTLRHRGQAELVAAVSGAVKRGVGDGAWRWDRRTSVDDVSALYAVTLAALGLAGTAAPSIW